MRSDVTKITLENENGTYSISIPHDMLNMAMLIESLLIPVLMAAGYGDETIARAFAEQDVV